MSFKQTIATIALLGSLLVLVTGCFLVNSPPMASFTATPTSGEAPLNVSFNASSSYDSDGSIATYAWSFGDGESGSGVTVSHIYDGAGNYTATLTVCDNAGAIDSAIHTIAVSGSYSPSPPTPDYSVTVGTIIDEFDTNEVAAEMKYEGKLIAATGYIRDFGTYWNDEPIVSLNSHLGGSTFDCEVLCYFPVEAQGTVAQLSKGDYVTIVGEYWMYGLCNVYLHYCYLP